MQMNIRVAQESADPAIDGARRKVLPIGPFAAR